MNELTKDDKPKTITLGDKTFTLSPVNLNVLTAIEDEFNCTFSQIAGEFEKREMNALRTIVWILVKENHDITKEELGKLIRFEDIPDVSLKVKMTLGGQ